VEVILQYINAALAESEFITLINLFSGNFFYRAEDKFMIFNTLEYDKYYFCRTSEVYDPLQVSISKLSDVD